MLRGAWPRTQPAAAADPTAVPVPVRAQLSQAGAWLSGPGGSSLQLSLARPLCRGCCCRRSRAGARHVRVQAAVLHGAERRDPAAPRPSPPLLDAAWFVSRGPGAHAWNSAASL